MTAKEAHPLAWPPGWPRAERPALSQFATTPATARAHLLRELRLLGATGVVITCNAARNRDGSLSARQPRLDDQGVAVYFTLDGTERCIPCDRWLDLHDNVRAIGLSVAALRGLHRWGTGGMVAAAFAGFAALPAGGEDPPWWETLGVLPDAEPGAVAAAYRRLAKAAHPDAPGGDADRFRRVAAAYAAARATWPGNGR